MGGGNGCKADQKRRRNAQNKEKESKLKNRSTEPPKRLTCQICKWSVLSFQKNDALAHAEKHAPSTLNEIFPELGVNEE